MDSTLNAARDFEPWCENCSKMIVCWINLIAIYNVYNYSFAGLLGITCLQPSSPKYKVMKLL